MTNEKNISEQLNLNFWSTCEFSDPRYKELISKSESMQTILPENGEQRINTQTLISLAIGVRDLNTLKGIYECSTVYHSDDYDPLDYAVMSYCIDTNTNWCNDKAETKIIQYLLDITDIAELKKVEKMLIDYQQQSNDNTSILREKVDLYLQMVKDKIKANEVSVTCISIFKPKNVDITKLQETIATIGLENVEQILLIYKN